MVGTMYMRNVFVGTDPLLFLWNKHLSEFCSLCLCLFERVIMLLLMLKQLIHSSCTFG